MPKTIPFVLLFAVALGSALLTSRYLAIGDSASINGTTGMTSLLDFEDWFEFDAAVATRLILVLGYTSGDFNIEVYDQSGALIDLFSSFNLFGNSFNPVMGEVVVPAGPVFVLVNSFFSVTNYTLDVMAATP